MIFLICKSLSHKKKYILIFLINLMAKSALLFHCFCDIVFGISIVGDVARALLLLSWLLVALQLLAL